MRVCVCVGAGGARAVVEGSGQGIYGNSIFHSNLL